ncbi:MAG TPA: hypothetical protein VIX35_06135, partial [Vicinamibacterales bacterium]
MKILLVGHGRMGRLVEGLAAAYDCEVVGVVSSRAAGTALDAQGAEVAIDFSIGSAVPETLSGLAAQRINVVIGTTGWQASEGACRDIVDRAGIGVIASANFALGLHIFRRVVSEAAARFAAQPDIGAW